MKNNRGISTVLLTSIIFLVGITVGGVMYFVGFQNRKIEPPKVSSQTPVATNQEEDISNSLDEKVIESELDNTKLEDVVSDLKGVEDDASKLK